MTTARWLRALLILALLAGLTACAGMQPLPFSDPLPDQAAAESSGPPPLPETGSQTICLRLLLVPDQARAQAMRDQIDGVAKFLVMSRELTRDDRTGPRLRCLPPADMGPEILASVQDLPLGQVSSPFAVGRQWALAMRTTDAYWRRGNELFDQGRYAEAEAALLKEVELNPDGPGWHLIAMARIARKEPRAALAAYDQALAWAPLDPRLLSDKAGVLLDLGRGDEAAAVYEKALAQAPGNPVVMNNLAWCLARQGRDLPRAEDLAGQAVGLQPEQPKFWDTLGLVQRLRGNNLQAARSYHQALRLDPNLPQARANLTPTLLALEPEELERLLLLPAGGGNPTPSRR